MFDKLFPVRFSYCEHCNREIDNDCYDMEYGKVIECPHCSEPTCIRCWSAEDPILKDSKPEEPEIEMEYDDHWQNEVIKVLKSIDKKLDRLNGQT